MIKPLLPVVTALCTAALVLIAPAASADIVDDGQWWISDYDIKEFHESGVDGSGVTIAVIDAGINMDLPEFEGADITVHEPSYCYEADGVERPATTTDVDEAWHGSNVAAMIVGNGNSGDGVLGVAPRAKLLFYTMGKDSSSCFDADGTARESWDFAAAINQATADGADIISMSIIQTGNYTEYPAINSAIAAAQRAGIIIVGGLSNQEDSAESSNVDAMPASNNGVVSVGAFGDNGTVNTSESFGDNSNPYTDVLAPGIDLLARGESGVTFDGLSLTSGTSFATPITAGNLALAMQKYPDATSNQVIQSLIHNTGSEPHDLEYDSEGVTGYGFVDTISLLAADPTQYEDTNPLISDDVDGLYFMGPTRAEIEGEAPSASPSADASASAAPSEVPSPEASPTTAPVEEPTDSNSSTMLLLLGLVAIAIVVGGIVVAIVISKNRNKGEPHGNL